MGKMFTLASLALIVALVAWVWITLRKHSARKRLEEERAAAFMAETASALRKGRNPPDKT
jgi:ABC-type bacteriocin/lantibiotic exporter with double-glycine peptidase domain